MRLCALTIIGLAVCTGIGLAASGDRKKPAANPNEVEVLLSDGSRVRMTMLQETIDVETKYGRLTIPTADIRRIEFGIHPTDDVAAKVERAVKRLGSDTFKEREEAADELVAVGAPAYIGLYKASHSPDLEVVKRAKAVLERIRKKVPEEQLRVRDDDLVRTADFAAVGRISVKTIKATTAIFGEAQLKVTDLRSIRWLSAQADTDVTVEGAKYAVGPTKWMDTGIEVSPDDDLVITAAGQVDLMTDGSGQYVVGPAGNAQWNQNNGANPPGALLARIGEDGQTFLVGEKYQGAARREGKLYLQISMSPWARNGGGNVTGSYKVHITGGRESK